MSGIEEGACKGCGIADHAACFAWPSLSRTRLLRTPLLLRPNLDVGSHLSVTCDIQRIEPVGGIPPALALQRSEFWLKRHASQTCPRKGFLFHPLEPTARPSGLFPSARRYRS
jgi:hypothetical protein